MCQSNNMRNQSGISLLSRKTFEEKEMLNSLNTLFKEQRGYEFKIPKPGTPVLLILSGGLDSTMLWFHLLHTYKLRVFPLYLTSPFMNRNHIPGEYASVSFFFRYFKKKYGNQVEAVKYIPVDLSFSLTSNTNIKILQNNWRILANNIHSDTKLKTGSVYLLDYPTRYARFLLSAYEYGLSLQAQKIDVCNVFFGVVPNDAEIGREPTLTILRSLNLYLCLLLGDWKWQITGPVDKKNQFYYPKEKSIQIARKHHIPLHKTWSCVRPLPWHCGICNACRYRHASFLSAHIPDKTFYLISPSIKKYVKIIAKRLYALIHIQRHSSKSKKQMYTMPTKIAYRGGVVSLHPHTESFQSGNRLFIHNRLTEETTQLNTIGELIYKHILQKSNTSFSSLIRLVERHYPTVSRSVIQKNIQVFIEELKTKKIIVEKKN